MFVSRRRLLQGSLLSAAAMAQGSWQALAQEPAASPTADQRNRMAELAGIFMNAYGVPGLSVAIAIKGRPAYVEAFGVADRPSAANPRYAKGFFLNSGNWWHSGLLDGTTTISVRTRGDFCWSAFTNTRSSVDDMTRSLDQLVWNMVRSVTGWHPDRA